MEKWSPFLLFSFFSLTEHHYWAHLLTATAHHLGNMYSIYSLLDTNEKERLIETKERKEKAGSSSNKRRLSVSREIRKNETGRKMPTTASSHWTDGRTKK
jgi:hypothetical protein